MNSSISDVVIRARDLGKRYRIGMSRQRHKRYKSLREVLARRVARLVAGRRTDGRRTAAGHVWALRGVSFEVEQGEVLGIIGRNGAGKSTLLKILSRITEPTEGECMLRGRVGSLLEVGTGFHPELTGRENVYLNGAILGMHRREIDRKFDEIVAFSEVEQFIDTPVKFFSSGMHLRLAFSVAAHLEPEILVVDEVLAVGDAAFQKKCLNKMSEVGGQGRTVLFVSHNMSAIARLCSRAMWLEGGQILKMGRAEEVIQQYLAVGISDAAVVQFDADSRRRAYLTAVSVLDGSGRPSKAVLVDQPFKIRLSYEVRQRLPSYWAGVKVRLPDGFDVLISTTSDYGDGPTSAAPGRYEAIIEFPARLLAPGEYLLSAFLNQPGKGQLDNRENVLRFSVIGDPFGSRGKRLRTRRKGILAWPFGWTLRQVEQVIPVGDR